MANKEIDLDRLFSNSSGKSHFCLNTVIPKLLENGFSIKLTVEGSPNHIINKYYGNTRK